MRTLFLLAMALPTLVIFRVPPLHTVYNQALALTFWGILIYRLPQSMAARRKTYAFQVGLVILLALSAAHSILNSPAHLIIAYAVIQASALLVFSAGTHATAEPKSRIPALFFQAVCITSILNAAICYLQVYVPQIIDHVFVAQPWSADRATGNIRQPNLMALQCVWGIVGLAFVFENRKIGRVLFGALTMFLCAAVAMTGSRTGFLLIACLAGWGLLDAQLRRVTRIVLAATPLLVPTFLYALSASATQHGRVVSLESGRYDFWKQVIYIIREHPLLGVGLANLNFAWTLTPFKRQNPETFTHAHNLVLQWAVELGVPLTVCLVTIFALSVYSALFKMRSSSGSARLQRKCSLVMVMLVLVHSQVEYPLWYAFFLLPAAFAWGMMSGESLPTLATPAIVGRFDFLRVGGLCMALAAAASVFDYQKIVEIYRPWPTGPSDEQRIQNGRSAVAYGYLADRFAGTLAKDGHRILTPFHTATREVIDMRLLIAWSLAMRETGHLDKARYLAQRVKDFNDPVSKQFFEKCGAPGGASERPWQCTPPTGHYSYKDFL